MLLDQEIHERGGCIKKTVRMITEQPCSPFEAKMAAGGALIGAARRRCMLFQMLAELRGDVLMSKMSHAAKTHAKNNTSFSVLMRLIKRGRIRATWGKLRGNVAHLCSHLKKPNFAFKANCPCFGRMIPIDSYRGTQI
jgi:hypothetical protein